MDFGYYLSSVPPIVECIFKNLNGRELDTCSQVCELWKRCAETEKKRREDIVCFFEALHCSHHKKIHSSCRECFTDVLEDIETDFDLHLKDLKMKPNFCLAFSTTYFINDFSRLYSAFQFYDSTQAKRMKHEDIVQQRAYLKEAMNVALVQYLPENCPLTFCVASGIIGCQDLKPVEIEDGWGITGILIPYVPGLQIYNFPIEDKKCDLSKVVPKDTTIKCLLVFTLTHESSLFTKIMQSCLLKENSQVAIGGAVIERSESPRGSVIAFCGRSVEAASVIIKPHDKVAQLEQKLLLFKETGLLQDRCFAFMFACVARGFINYRRYNLESSVFHKLYPEVPLMGAFGNGEIGIEYLPNTPNTSKNEVLRIGKFAKCRKKYLHSYTTVFVLVSLKL